MLSVSFLVFVASAQASGPPIGFCLMLQHIEFAEPLPPLNLQALSPLDDIYMQSPSNSSDGLAARAHAARKSAFLSMSPTCNFEAFSLHFHLPLKVAAEKFGVRATAFKKRCRAIGIRHWPYRKVRSLKRSLLELNRCKEQAPLNDKQEAQYATFKRQLDKLMNPETYGLDPSGRLSDHHHRQLLASDDDDEDAESDDGNDSFTASPRYNEDLLFSRTISPTDGGSKTLGDVIPAGSAHLRTIRRNQVLHLPSAHWSTPSLFESDATDASVTMGKETSNNRSQCSQMYGFHGSNLMGFGNPSAVERAAALIMKTSPSNQPRYRVQRYFKSEADRDQAVDYPPSALDTAEIDFLHSEMKYTDLRSLNDADDEFTAHANQVDYTSERFFDDVFLQISPDYGCLV
ncbi:hypothetical protein PHYBOEH_007916 [Phytophthora boehmeriae]|uniref:RWP-RK domain-containing protein n=1 Tax=Phytophthora boehmeriae TaxID=109152 RepID=A0A8T1W7Y8_9STRA|nr:hypothetical protein PHYBOEH_007916 [Phytophthora boehmeriae]